MNKLSIILLLFAASVSAQVGIGTGAIPSNKYVSIEFGTATPAENKGIILPWVTSESAVSNAVVGTLIFDSATQKVKIATSSTPATASTPTSVHTSWMDLSNGAAKPTIPFVNSSLLNEASRAQVIVGSTSTAAPGILVLENKDPINTPQVMVLPRVNNYTDIVNPAAGMIVYVKTNKRLAVFNGKEWSFWQP